MDGFEFRVSKIQVVLFGSMDWPRCDAKTSPIQQQINLLLIELEELAVEELTEDSIELVLTQEQADGIASSPEYRMMCFGAPDAIHCDPADYQRHEDAMAGRPVKLVTGNHLYGIPVRVSLPVGEQDSL